MAGVSMFGGEEKKKSLTKMSRFYANSLRSGRSAKTESYNCDPEVLKITAVTYKELASLEGIKKKKKK